MCNEKIKHKKICIEDGIYFNRLCGEYCLFVFVFYKTSYCTYTKYVFFLNNIFNHFQKREKELVALRSINDSRMRLYENLEGSIAELEHDNNRLGTENLINKKKNKS